MCRKLVVVAADVGDDGDGDDDYEEEGSESRLRLHQSLLTLQSLQFPDKPRSLLDSGRLPE